MSIHLSVWATATVLLLLPSFLPMEAAKEFSRSDGYLFDHRSRAIRLVLNHKRSIEEWANDEEYNDRVGSLEENPTQAALATASDDLPVDSAYRSEASIFNLEAHLHDSMLHDDTDPDAAFWSVN